MEPLIQKIWSICCPKPIVCALYLGVPMSAYTGTVNSWPSALFIETLDWIGPVGTEELSVIIASTDSLLGSSDDTSFGTGFPGSTIPKATTIGRA